MFVNRYIEKPVLEDLKEKWSNLRAMPNEMHFGKEEKVPCSMTRCTTSEKSNVAGQRRGEAPSAAAACWAARLASLLRHGFEYRCDRSHRTKSS